MRWLRYFVDCLAAWFEPFCKYDWNDSHMDFEHCDKCQRIACRNVRIARYRVSRRMPRARVKVLVS